MHAESNYNKRGRGQHIVIYIFFHCDKNICILYQWLCMYLYVVPVHYTHYLRSQLQTIYRCLLGMSTARWQSLRIKVRRGGGKKNLVRRYKRRRRRADVVHWSPLEGNWSGN